MSSGRRWLIAVALLVLAIPGMYSAMAAPETEPNDSLDSPQILSVGEIEGGVSSVYNMSFPYPVVHTDRDVYAVDVPGMHALEVKLKKTDLGPHSIGMIAYDEDKMRMYSTIDMVLSVPGETGSGIWENEQDSVIRVHLALEGNGTYILGIEKWEIAPDENEMPPQRYDSWSVAQPVEEGSFNGSVHDIDPAFPGSHYYRIMVPSGEALEIILKKTDNGTGVVFLHTYSGNYESPLSRDIALSVSDPGGNDSDIYECYYCSDSSVIVVVRGRGEYELTMRIVPSQEEPYPDAEIMLVLMLFIMMFTLLPLLIAMIVPMITLIIIIAIIVWAVKRSNASTKGSKPSNVGERPIIASPPPGGKKKKKKPSGMGKDEVKVG